VGGLAPTFHVGFAPLGFPRWGPQAPYLSPTSRPWRRQWPCHAGRAVRPQWMPCTSWRRLSHGIINVGRNMTISCVRSAFS